MDLFCPHCTRRVTVSDDKAGQIVNCPLCAKQFMTPSLAPATQPVSEPMPSPVLAPTVPTDSFQLAPAPAPVQDSPPPAPKLSEPVPTPPSPPPAPPGDYTGSYSLYLRSHWLAFVSPVCLVLIFVLSFVPWERQLSLWGLAFTQDGKALFLAYVLLLLLCILLALAALVFEKQWVAIPPSLVPLILWKDLIVALFLSIGFMLLAFEYLEAHTSYENPIRVSMKIAFRLHFLAIIGSLLMFWLHWRKLSNSPPPKFELRW